MKSNPKIIICLQSYKIITIKETSIGMTYLSDIRNKASYRNSLVSCSLPAGHNKSGKAESALYPTGFQIGTILNFFFKNSYPDLK